MPMCRRMPARNSPKGPRSTRPGAAAARLRSSPSRRWSSLKKRKKGPLGTGSVVALRRPGALFAGVDARGIMPEAFDVVNVVDVGGLVPLARGRIDGARRPETFEGRALAGAVQAHDRLEEEPVGHGPRGLDPT